MPQPVNISASRGASILGLSKWSTPVQEFLKIMGEDYCKKNNFEYPVVEYNAAMRWGHAFESSIIELAEQTRSCRIVEREKLFEQDFLTCHVDGMYEIKPFIVHEGKTTNIRSFRDNFGEPGTDQVPIEYQLQCQHQMICTGAEKVILSVLVFPRRVEEWEEMGIIPMQMVNGVWRFTGEFQNYSIIGWAQSLDQMGYFHQYEIHANTELQELMIEKYTYFWNNHILTGIPPEPKTYDDIKALVREPVGTIVADETIERLASEYKQIKSEISGTGPLAKRADMIKVELLNYMSKHEKIDDEDSQDKFILRDRSGKKLVSYSKNKNGNFIFR